MIPFLAFDLEIATVWESGKPFSPVDGLGISCAAVCDQDGTLWLWVAGIAAAPMRIADYASMTEETRRDAIKSSLFLHQYEPLRCGFPPNQIAPRFAKWEARCLLDWLQMRAPVVTWNGLAFDMHVLAVESGDYDLAGQLAMQHVDLMFAFLSAKGYRLSLKAAAEGVGSKKGVAGADNGADAPQLWAQGDYVTALQYVAQDVIALRDVTAAVIRDGGFSWTAKSGRLNSIALPRDLEALRVSEVVQWPEPDQSWMDDPPNRHDAYRWIRIREGEES